MSYDRAFVAWSILVVLSLWGGLVYANLYATDPDFAPFALIQSAIIGVSISFGYFQAVKMLRQRSLRFKSLMKTFAIGYAGIFCFLTLAAVAPSEHKDEHALTRFAIGLTVVGAITVIHALFWRASSSNIEAE